MELIINNKNKIQVELEGLNTASINGEKRSFDVLKTGDNEYNILVNNRSYNLFRRFYRHN